MGDGNDGRRHRRALRAVSHANHERTIDIEGVDRQTTEVAQRRVARAEVVDGHGKTVFTGKGEFFDAAGEVVDENTLGDLEIDAGTRVRVALDRSLETDGKI